MNINSIYCTTFSGLTKAGTSVTGNATQCGIRVGNTIAYPIINHRGYETPAGSGKYKMCSASAVLSNKFSKIECNSNNLMLTLLMYGDSHASNDWSMSNKPTPNPTPLPGKPTAAPSLAPSQRPTIRTRKPTIAPSAMPSFIFSDDDFDSTTGTTTNHGSAVFSYPFYSGSSSTTADDDDCNYGDCNTIKTADDDYGRGVVDDDVLRDNFFEGEPIDSGDVFTYMRWVAQNYYNNTKGQGDIFVSRNAYSYQDLALGTLSSIDTAGFVSGNSSFATMCGPVKTNCTSITFSIDNGVSKKANKYIYTPSSKLAYTDVMYFTANMGRNISASFSHLHLV